MCQYHSKDSTMLELTPSDIQARDQLCKTLVETFAALEDAIAASNAAMQAAYETLQPHVERYNSTVQDAGEWLADLVSAMEAYQDERSEAWQDSATGQAYEAWLDAYRSADLETVDIEAPEPVEIPEHGPQDDVLDLPECPEASLPQETSARSDPWHPTRLTAACAPWWALRRTRTPSTPTCAPASSIERLTAAIERLDVPQARIETLLARLRRQEENGQDA